MKTSLNTDGFAVRFDEAGGTRSIVIEDDVKVAYAYLLQKGSIVADVWLYNVAEAPDRVNWRDRALMPFMNPKKFCKDVPTNRITAQSNISIIWSDEVSIELDGAVIAKLKDGEKPGRSVMAAVQGPLAIPLVSEE